MPDVSARKRNQERTKGPKCGTVPIVGIPVPGHRSRSFGRSLSRRTPDLVLLETIVQTGPGKAGYAASLFYITPYC